MTEKAPELLRSSSPEAGNSGELRAHPYSYVRWGQAEVESLPDFLDWATSQVRNAEAGIGKGLAGEQRESAKEMVAQLNQVRRASVADPVVQVDLGLNTTATGALITSFSTQTTTDPMSHGSPGQAGSSCAGRVSC